MLYVAIALLLAIWTGWDSRARGAPVWPFWALLVLLVPFPALPVYLALRPLKAGEVRAGGRAWQVLRWLALGWSVAFLPLAWFIWYQMAGDRMNAIQGLATLAMLFVLWLVPMLVALVLGFFLRRPEVVERGELT